MPGFMMTTLRTKT